ncbi:carbohydrate kinase family protein [Thermogladius sp. 4427co]|uniref:carbohydrate kinase family protein n=1 Tax=Thermogladius sp. 4427co TaxID=3450718 RepID=UPI003F79C6C2
MLKQTWGAGGSAVNVSIAGSRLGLKTSIIAKIGFDNFGRIVVDELLRENVDISGLRVGFSPTGVTIVVINSRGEIIMFGHKGAAEELSPQEVSEYIISRSKWVHIASLNLDTTLKVIEISSKYSVPVSWDPGRLLSKKPWSDLEKVIKSVRIVFANEQEYANMTGVDDYRKAAEKIVEAGAEIAVVKRGEKGAYLKTREIEEESPAYQVREVVDTTGAGDAFAAGFIAGILRGYSLRKALSYANAVAALKITRLGSHEVPRHEEVVDFIWERGVV